MKPTPTEHPVLPPGPIYYLQSSVAVPPTEDDEFSFIDLIRFLRRSKWIVLATVAFTSICAAIWAISMAPVYRAEVLLATAEQDAKGGMASTLSSQIGGLASLAGIDFGKGGGNKLEEVIAISRSRVFLTTFIKEKNLMPLLFPLQWDAGANAWNKESQPPTLEQAYAQLKNVIKIVTDKKTGLTTLSVEWSDAVVAASWANEIVQRLNLNQKQEAIRDAKQIISYLQKQLEETSVIDMRQVIYRLIESQTQKIVLANVRDEFAFKVIDPAVAPINKVKPQRTLIVGVGMFLGVLIGILIAAIKFNSSKQTYSREDP